MDEHGQNMTNSCGISVKYYFCLQEVPDGSVKFPTGTHVFVVELRPKEMAVWLQGRPEHAVTVPVKESYNKLRVRHLSFSKESPRVVFGSKLFHG